MVLSLYGCTGLAHGTLVVGTDKRGTVSGESSGNGATSLSTLREVYYTLWVVLCIWDCSAFSPYIRKFSSYYSVSSQFDF